MKSPLAVIDLGTNTARLLIGSKESDGSITHHLLKRHITRLGGGFSHETGISPEAKERTVAAMLQFSHDIGRHGVSQIRAVATSAVRDAVNGAEFCADIFAATGIRLEVIDGDLEGKVTLKGVMAGLDHKEGDIFLFDVGGGSTEYTLASNGQPLFTRSLPLGVVRLTEGKATTDAMAEKIRKELDQLKDVLASTSSIPDPGLVTLVATAGTATTLAAISLKMTDYDYRRVNNYHLSRNEIREIRDILLPLAPQDRLSIPGVEKGREDLIVAGLLVTLATMELFSFDHLTVSDFGLLEGLMVEF